MDQQGDDQTLNLATGRGGGCCGGACCGSPRPTEPTVDDTSVNAARDIAIRDGGTGGIAAQC